MKGKIRKFWTNLKNKFSKNNTEYVYPMQIPLAGIKQDQVIIDREAGYVLVDIEQQIVIEEADRFSPSKMYSSFGFYRSVFLPEGVSIKEIDTQITADQLKIGWPKRMLNQ